MVGGPADSALEARFQRAIEAHRAGRLAEALPVYREVLERDPDHAEAHHMMAVVHFQEHRPAEAEAEVRRAIAGSDRPAKFHNTHGNILVALGRPLEARLAFERALERDPHFPGAAYNLGTVLIALGRPEQAEAVFRGLIASGSAEPLVFNNLGTALIKQNRHAQAIACCRDGLEHHPGEARLTLTLASALELANDIAGAEEAMRRVPAAADRPEGRLVMARILRRRRKSEEALAMLTPALSAPLSDVDRAETLYERGLILDELGACREAFAAFQESKGLQARTPEAATCNRDAFLRTVRASHLAFPGILAPHSGSEARGGVRPPVFFVGFPRSGTTLMEQVLKSHPDLVTTEENSPLSPLILDLGRRGEGYPASVAHLGSDDVTRLRRRFWEAAVEAVGPLAGRALVDKLPLNIVNLALINLLFPDARVLVALRDPRDACLSCFIQRFRLNDAMANFLDIRRVGETYAAVMDLWLHYRRILTVPWMEYRYEDLVDDFEGTVRRVLDFIGVGWHDSVAGYREKAAERTIKTPSYRDVTQPIYSRSVARWVGYAEDLAPILPVISPFIHAFGYGEEPVS